METTSGPTAAPTPPGSHGSPAATPGAQDYLSSADATSAATTGVGQVPTADMQPYFNLGMPSMQTLYPVSFPGAMPPTAGGMPLMQVLQPMALPGGMGGTPAPFMMQPFQYSLPVQAAASSTAAAESPGTNSLPSPAMPASGGGSRSGTPSGLTPEQQQRMQQLGMVMAPGVHPGVPPGQQVAQQHKMPEVQSKPAVDPATLPKPPKKPLTPYMRFSKSIWQNVKSQNQSMSVCEIGATIGRMWRELSDEQKQKYNEEFQSSKVQYEEDLQEYLKVTGLQPSDLVKPRNKKKDKDVGKVLPRKPSPSMPQRHFAPPAMMAGGAAFPAQLGRMAAFGGDQTAEALSSALPHFSQVWASGQANPMMAAAAAAAAAAKESGGVAANGNMVSHAYYQAAAAAAAAAPGYGGSPVGSQQRASPHLSTPSPLGGGGGEGEVLNFSRSGSWPWPQQQMGTVEQYTALQQQQLQQQQQAQMAAAAMNEAANARGDMEMEMLLKQQQQQQQAQQQQQQQGSRPSSQNGVDLSMLGQDEQRQPTPAESQPDDATVKKPGNNGTDPTAQQQQQQRNDYWNMHYPHY